MHRSKQHCYSITSSANEISPCWNREAERLSGLEVDDHFELAEDLSYRAAYAAFSKPSACIASLTFGRAPTRSA